MAVTVLGPAWSATGRTQQDTGRFPLGVEAATLTNAGLLAPMVTAGTAHAAYYLLHAHLARERAAPHDESLDQARLRIRRAEVVLAAVSLRHEDLEPDQHHAGARLGEPHGARLVRTAVDAGLVPVTTLAAWPPKGTYSRQRSGFHAIYRGAEATAGLIDPSPGTFAPGPVDSSAAEPQSLSDLVAASAADTLDLKALDALTGACVCRMRAGAPAAGIRELLFGGAHAPAAPAGIVQQRHRTRRTAELLLAALNGHPTQIGDERLMADLVVTGTRTVPETLTSWAAGWAGAVLRNASVTAVRWLWSWLTQQLPDTLDGACVRLGNALAAGADSSEPVGPALMALPATQTAAGALLYPEGDLLATAATPWDYLRLLALGAQRTAELTGPTRARFLAAGALGPVWARDWLAARHELTVSELGRELGAFLFRTAEETSRARARWEGSGWLRLPTRLRRVGDVYDLVGAEGTVIPGLRLGRLRNILTEVGLIEIVDGLYRTTTPSW